MINYKDKIEIFSLFKTNLSLIGSWIRKRNIDRNDSLRDGRSTPIGNMIDSLCSTLFPESTNIRPADGIPDVYNSSGITCTLSK